MAKDKAPPDEPIMPAEEVQALLEAATRDGVRTDVQTGGTAVRKDVN